MNFVPEIIMAYVDGELDTVTARRLEKAMGDDAELEKKVAVERRLRERISAHYDPVVDEPIPDHLVDLIESSPRVDTTLGERRAHRISARANWVQAGAIAASLAIGVVVGQFAFRGVEDHVAENRGVLFASGELETALDTQLASTQEAGSATRIGLTFRSRLGEVCRTFEAQAMAGIACNDGDSWQMRRIFSNGEPADRLGRYRQASSGEIAAAAQAMMDGDPLDAKAEQALQEHGWKFR